MTGAVSSASSTRWMAASSPACKMQFNDNKQEMMALSCPPLLAPLFAQTHSEINRKYRRCACHQFHRDYYQCGKARTFTARSKSALSAVAISIALRKKSSNPAVAMSHFSRVQQRTVEAGARELVRHTMPMLVCRD